MLLLLLLPAAIAVARLGLIRCIITSLLIVKNDAIRETCSRIA